MRRRSTLPGARGQGRRPTLLGLGRLTLSQKARRPAHKNRLYPLWLYEYGRFYGILFLAEKLMTVGKSNHKEVVAYERRPKSKNLSSIC